MNVEEYSAQDATGLTELIRSGQVSRPEVDEVAREAIGIAAHRLDPFAVGPFDEPLQAAPDGPFAGVPFVLKDLA